MALVDPSASQTPVDPPPAGRLDSWKEIAAYLKRDESTVRRWEEEGLPVHRLPHKKKATVYAFKSELDVWWSDGRSRLEAAGITSPNGADAPDLIPAPDSRARLRWVAAGVMLLLAVALALAVAERQRVFGGPRAGEIASIAVLPLKNLSGDSEQNYFADGMTEALITRLGQISALHVISHQSVLGYRDTTKSVPQIARELNVDALVEGTVLHSGNRVRITANFVQAVPERHLWAESYEFDRQDVLGVQGQVARDVASRIQIKVTPQERGRLTVSRQVDPEAYEAYLLGRGYFYKRRTPANAARAREYFEKAIQKDARYAPAYASLAELYIWTGGAGTLTKERSGYREAHVEARKWAEKALELDDMLADAHNALATVKQSEWDWAGAEEEYRRAIDLNPGYAVAHISYAMHLYGMERFEEAAAEARRAQQLDPAAPLINTWAGATYVLAGRHAEGMASLQKALDLEPSYYDASLVLARTYVSNGKYHQAIAELEKALALNPRDPALAGALAYAHARSGNREKALELVEQLKRNGGRQPGNQPTFALVWAYAGLNDRERAFVWLERAHEERRQRLTWLNVDPLLEPLRSDPRFTDLVHRIGLPQR
jgi:TolB-like protein/Tfp pilus assembly protein PilF